MTHLKIYLAKLNGEGVYASIENEEGYDLGIYQAHWNGCPVEGCKEAAKQLREAADRFDKLALMKKPFHSATHTKVNR